jgi:hypothetical protein
MTAGLLYMLEGGDVGLTQEFRISQTTRPANQPTNYWVVVVVVVL